MFDYIEEYHPWWTIEYRCLPMTPYALTRSYKYPSNAIWICHIAARVPFLAVVRGCTGWCVGKPGEHKGRNQRNWYTPFAARLEGGCTSCAACFGRRIATCQMAHLAELPKPGRVESFKCWTVEYLKYIDIILTYCHFVEICRHGDVGLQK